LEEPTERQNCNRIELHGCLETLREFLDDYRTSVYAYNSKIRETGYYLKPVHKVYYKDSRGTKIIYEYYGVYWWKKQKRGYRIFLKYYGKQKPEHLPEPPTNPLAGVVINHTEGTIILPKYIFDKLKTRISGCKTRCLD